MKPATSLLRLALYLLLSAPAMGVQAQLVGLDASPDVTVTLSSATIRDEQLASDALAGSVTPRSLPGLPPEAAIIAYHVLAGGGTLLALESATPLPSSSGSIVARPGDVLRFDGSVYAKRFDAAVMGVPAGVHTDAVTMIGSDLLLSFDTTVQLGAVVANDEDVVRLRGSSFSLFLDMSEVGIPAGLDLDALHYVATTDRLLVSFDGSGRVDGVDFDDEDVLELDATDGFALAYDGSLQHTGWRAGDLDALDARTDADLDGVEDGADNCPFTANAGQSDRGGVAGPLDTQGIAADGIGDACQCGDASGDGRVTGIDGTLLARCFLGLRPCGPAGLAALPGGIDKCGVGGAPGCDASEATLVKRATLGLAPAIRQLCPAATTL